MAAIIALLIAAALVTAGLQWSRALERRYVHEFAPEFSDSKLQGVALQQEAFHHPDLLVFYGSSELVKEMPNNATEFFENYPTGFRVFPVGKPGTTSLAVLQKAAAVGKAMKGRKVAYSISPGWFFTEVFDPKYYEGNFSELQACQFAFSSDLSWDLKRDVARRMLQYQKTLDDRWLLEFALERLAGDTVVDRVGYGIVWPLGRLQAATGCAQDHVEVALQIMEKAEEGDDGNSPKHVYGLNWNELLKRAAKYANAAATKAKTDEVARKRIPRASRDRTFLQTMASAREWTDIELLMRTFHELGAEPLLLTMPVEDSRLEVYGVSSAARNAYLQRLDGLADEYDFPLLAFREYEKDPTFMVDFLDHLSGKGWLYYNKALDDFYHGRQISTL